VHREIKKNRATAKISRRFEHAGFGAHLCEVPSTPSLIRTLAGCSAGVRSHYRHCAGLEQGI